VVVRPARIRTYTVRARLYTYEGPDQSLVLQAADTELALYQRDHHRVEHDITMSGLTAALHRPGVQRVEFDAPIDTVRCGEDEAAFCIDNDVRVAGTAL
jgi:phage-related baseplate assembly protein